MTNLDDLLPVDDLLAVAVPQAVGHLPDVLRRPRLVEPGGGGIGINPDEAINPGCRGMMAVTLSAPLLGQLWHGSVWFMAWHDTA